MPTKITYDGNEIADFSSGAKALKCEGKTMTTVVIVEDITNDPVINPLSVSSNGTYNAPSGVDGYNPVTVNVSGGAPTTITAGDTPVAMTAAINRRTGTTYAAIDGQSITIKKAGTYRFRWTMFRSSTSGTFGTQLYKGTTAQGSAKTSWSNHAQTCSQDITCAAGDVISIYGRSGSTSNYIYAGNLTACINWDTGF